MSEGTALPAEVEREEAARGLLWACLACAFSYPSGEMLERLEAAVPELERAAAILDLRLPEGLGRAIARARGRLGELQGLYNRLFVTGLQAPITETSYELDKTARRAAELADVLGFYRAFGIRLGAPLAPDHLVAELEFLSLLTQKSRYFAETGDEQGFEVAERAYRSFLEDHLGRWYEVFLDRLEAATEDPFYRALAALLRDWLGREVARLGVRPLKLTRLAPEPASASGWSCPAGPGAASAS